MPAPKIALGEAARQAAEWRERERRERHGPAGRDGPEGGDRDRQVEGEEEGEVRNVTHRFDLRTTRYKTTKRESRVFQQLRSDF